MVDLSTISIGFVPMTWTVVWVGQLENLQLLGLQFQPIQEDINLTQKEVTTLEKAGFSFDHLRRNNTWSLFGFQSFTSKQFPCACYELSQLCEVVQFKLLLTIHGGKKVREPFMFKITQQHTNNWEAGMLFLQCTVFLTIDVPPLKYGQIYNIFSYDITIGNFVIIGCSCVYFVKMLVGSMGGHGVYVC
jgi:hypothetical protein